MPSPRLKLLRLLALVFILLAALAPSAKAEEEKTASDQPGDRKLFDDNEWREWENLWAQNDPSTGETFKAKAESLFQKHPHNASLALLLAFLHRELGDPDRSRQTLWRWWEAREKYDGRSPKIRASWSHRNHPPEKISRTYFQQLRSAEGTAALLLVQACEDFPEERDRLRVAMASQDNENPGGMHGPTRSKLKEVLSPEAFQRFALGDSGKEDPALWVILLGTISACGCPDSDDEADIAWKEKIALQLMREGKLSALVVAPMESPAFTEIFRWTMAQKLPEKTVSLLSVKSLINLYIENSLVSRLLPRSRGFATSFSLEDHTTSLPPGWTDEDWRLFDRLTQPDASPPFYPWQPDGYKAYCSPKPPRNYRLHFALNVQKANFEGMLQTYRDGETECLLENYNLAAALAHSIIQARRLDREVRWDILSNLLLQDYHNFLSKNEFWLEEPVPFKSENESSDNPADPFAVFQSDGPNPTPPQGPANRVRNPKAEAGSYFDEQVFSAFPPEARFPIWWHLHRANDAVITELHSHWMLKEYQITDFIRLPEKSENFPAAVLALARSLPPDFPPEARTWLPFLVFDANWTRFKDLPFLTRDTCRRLLEHEAALPEAHFPRAWLQTWTLLEWSEFELITGHQEAAQAPYWGTTKTFGWEINPAWPPPRIKLPPQVTRLLPLLSEPSIPPEVRLTFLLRTFKTSADYLPDPAVGELFIQLTKSLTPAGERAITDDNWYREGLYPYSLPLPPRDEEGRRLAEAIFKRWEFRHKAELQRLP